MVVYVLSCNKPTTTPNDFVPANYSEMFKALNLQFNVTYNYVEMINNHATGNKGTIRFSITDTSMVETYNARTTKDYFRLDSLKPYSAKFESLGMNKYNITQSLFINNARENISFVNGSSMVSFGTVDNGSFYFYQYLLFK